MAISFPDMLEKNLQPFWEGNQPCVLPAMLLSGKAQEQQIGGC